MPDWRPTVSLQYLAQRAQLLNQARHFFSKRDVLEVETPLACAHTVTEPNIESFNFSAEGTQRFLQTSPEYAMKRLLADGAPDIFQICKSFRIGEQGTLHNPEFTMIEWYRRGYCLKQMMQETVDLIVSLLAKSGRPINVEYNSYYDLTERALGKSLRSLSENEIKNLAAENGLVQKSDNSLEQCVDFLFSHKVQLDMCKQSITVVFHYPAAQAALSKLNEDDNTVSERFEVFYQGVELANGYVELLDPEQQLTRFVKDQQIRKQHGSTQVEIDQRLIDAQRHGLPECAGVAVGFDRVMMLAVGASSLSEVISFDWNNA
jgi:lysyl-tRNA synthetase class 2